MMRRASPSLATGCCQRIMLARISPARTRPSVLSLNDDQARPEVQRIVVADADIALRDADGGKDDGIFRRCSVAERDIAVAIIGICGAGIAGCAEAGNAQRELLRALKSG